MKQKIKIIWNSIKRSVLTRKLIRTIRLGKPLKVVIGASGIVQKGWLRTEVEFLNMLNLSDWQRFFKPNSIAVIIAEHVWEHLTISDGELAIQNCFEYLKPGGYLRIAVPDGFHVSKQYVEMVRPGGHGAGADDHKVLYNYQTLTQSLENAGFKTTLLEYFDEDGKFHFVEWSVEDGLIRRSKRFDQRNADRSLTYTSIIVDAFKPKNG